MTGGSFQEIFVPHWMFSAKFVPSILSLSPSILHCVNGTFIKMKRLAANVAGYFDGVPYYSASVLVGVIYSDILMWLVTSFFPWHVLKDVDWQLAGGQDHGGKGSQGPRMSNDGWYSWLGTTLEIWDIPPHHWSNKVNTFFFAGEGQLRSKFYPNDMRINEL